MLLEFRVKNFRSIKDEQILSLAASVDKTFANSHLLATELTTPPNVVRSSVIYGPNASGKSNLLQALSYMQAVIRDSATTVQPGHKYSVQPFRLDPQSLGAPTEFEVTFVEEGIRYQYGFSMTTERIVDEWLLVYRKPKPQQWINRRFDSVGNIHIYDFSSHLTGARKLWQDSTRENALFLSTAVQLNSESLRPIFSALVDKILYFAAGATPIPEFTTALLREPSGKQAVKDFLSDADITISDIQTVARKGFQQFIKFNPAGGAAQVSGEEKELLMPQFIHETEGGSVSFELHEESLGTQRLYSLAAPVLEVLRRGWLLVVDELDSSLHALLVRRLVNLFHNSNSNKNGAQLIFSTHDTSLLDETLFRRDQIWFTEKGLDQSTKLYPLSDFSPRKKEALERGYLAGRYGAIPFLSNPPSFADSAKVAE